MINTPSMQDLLTAGVHFGHKVSRAHPRMKSYIFGARDGVSIIDLAFSEEKLKEASESVYNFGKEGKILLIIGTKKQAQDIVKDLARENDIPYLTSRWIGGLLTNFDEIKRNVKKLLTLKDAKEKGTLQRTKKEQLLITRRLEKFDKEMGGVATMDKLPDGVFVVDGVSDNTAIIEARKMGLKVWGICDTNADPFWFDFPVPANDDGIKSIKIVCETVIDAYAKGRKDGGLKDTTKATRDADKKEAETPEDLSEETKKETEALEEVVEKAAIEDAGRKE